jgi:glycosyltransferase involved in cell wall biosynthesis
MPTVSIIVPNYNHSKFLTQRLDSVLNQTFQDFEVILLDDCSTDNSHEILEQYRNHPKVSQLIVNEKNSGSPFKQWAKGINFAMGEYIWIAESDDYSEPAFLQELVNILNFDSSLVLCFCKSNWINDKNEICKDLSIYKKSFKEQGLLEIKNKLVFKNTIQNASSALFRTNILKKVSTKYENYFSCGDWILYTEILQFGDLYFTDKILNNFRWYHNNTSNLAAKNGLWNYEGIDVLKIASKSIKFNYIEKKAILKNWGFKIEPLRLTRRIFYSKDLEFYLKLFLFAPFTFLKMILEHVLKF